MQKNINELQNFAFNSQKATGKRKNKATSAKVQIPAYTSPTKEKSSWHPAGMDDETALYMGYSPYTGEAEDVARQTWKAVGITETDPNKAAADYRRYADDKAKNVGDYFRGAANAFLKGEDRAADENKSESYNKGTQLWGNIRHELENVPLRAESALDSTVGAMEQAASSVIKPGTKMINRILYGTDDLSDDLLISFLENDADANMEAAQNDAQMAAEGYGTVGQLINNTEIAGFQLLGDMMTGSPMAAMMVRSFGSGAYEGRKRGHSDIQQVADGMKSAAIEYFTEKLFGGNPVYDADAGLINKAIERLGGSKELLGFLSSRPVETLNEFFEEVASGILDPITDYILYGEADWPTIKDLVDDGIVGLLLGAGGQGLQFLSGSNITSTDDNYVGTPMAMEEDNKNTAWNENQSNVSADDTIHSSDTQNPYEQNPVQKKEESKDSPKNPHALGNNNEYALLSDAEYDARVNAIQEAAHSGDFSRMAAALDVSERELWEWMEQEGVPSEPIMAEILQIFKPVDLDDLIDAMEESVRTKGQSVENVKQIRPSESGKNSLQIAENSDTLSSTSSFTSDNSNVSPSLLTEAAAENYIDDKPVDRIYYPDKKQKVKITCYCDGTAKIEYKGVTTRNVQQVADYSYYKRDRQEARTLRSRFSRSDRKAFLNYLVDEHLGALYAVGLTDEQIENMKNGKVPKGYEVHHLYPLDDGGTNDVDNLILIAEEYHAVFSSIQRSFCYSIKVGKAKTVNWLYPMGKVYNPYLRGE